MIDQHSFITRASSAMAVELDRELVLMSIDNGNYYSMTQTSRDIWQYLAVPISVADLCRTLHAKYRAAPAVIDADTLQFLTHLYDEKLIQRVEPT